MNGTKKTLTRAGFEKLFDGKFEPIPHTGYRVNPTANATTYLAPDKTTNKPAKWVQWQDKETSARTWLELAKKVGLTS